MLKLLRVAVFITQRIIFIRLPCISISNSQCTRSHLILPLLKIIAGLLYSLYILEHLDIRSLKAIPATSIYSVCPAVIYMCEIVSLKIPLIVIQTHQVPMETSTR